MSRRVLSSRLRGRKASVVGIALALTLTACGGGGGNGAGQGGPDGGAPEVEAPVILTIPEQLALAKSPIEEWTGPTEKVSPPRGIDLMILSCGSAYVGCTIAAEAAKDAAELLDWNVTIVNGDSDLSLWDSAARQVVADGYDAMIVMGGTPALLGGDLAMVPKAGIPMISVFTPPLDGAPDFNGYITVDHAVSGDLLGKFIVDDAAGPTKIMTLTSSEFPETATRHSALFAAIAENCLDCKIHSQFFDPEKIEDRLGGQTSALLRTTNPKASYIYSPFNATASEVLKGIHSREDISITKFVSVDGSPEAITRIQNGEQTAVMSSPQTYMGWLSVDQMARVLAEQRTERIVIVPERLITAENVGEVVGDQGWQLEFDFESKFRELWDQ